MYKVYILDDSVLVRKELVLTIPWESLDCTVIGQAGNGKVALKEIIDTNPDIVITDIRMPRMDGLQLISELKKLDFNNEFIVISAYSEFEYALTAIKLGVHDYILKPINDEELIQTIGKVIKRIKERKNSRVVTQSLDDKLSLNDINSDLFDNYANEKLSIHLRKAIEYLLLHYMKDLNVRDVAEELNISESYLTKIFKQETNTTFIEFLTNIRIREAIRLMKDNSLPIYMISEKVGYNDYRYFSTVFKKNVGISPKKYQNKII